MNYPMFARAVLFVFLVSVLVMLPSFVYSRTDIERNDLTETLFNVILTLASAGVAIALQHPAAERRAKQRWLPFAESACSDLVNIAAEAERMRRIQQGYCGKCKALVPSEDQEKFAAVMAMVDQHCVGAAEKLASLRERLHKAQRDWDGFIRNHCDGKECEEIQRRLKVLELELYRTMNAEVPAPGCSSTGDDTDNVPQTLPTGL